jgi:hypothetical protein
MSGIPLVNLTICVSGRADSSGSPPPVHVTRLNYHGFGLSTGTPSEECLNTGGETVLYFFTCLNVPLFYGRHHYFSPERGINQEPLRRKPTPDEPSPSFPTIPSFPSPTRPSLLYNPLWPIPRHCSRHWHHAPLDPH